MANENIIIFNLDDMGFGDVFQQPFPVQFTELNQIFKTQGLRIRFGCSGAAICSPSRYAMLTGRRPNDDGLHTTVPNDPGRNTYTGIPTGTATLAKVLNDSAANYYCGNFGKWHLEKHAGMASLFSLGFDEMQGHAYPATQAGVTNGYLGADFIALGAGGELAYSRDADELIADKVIDCIDNAVTATRPFFIMANFFTPHAPLNPSSSDLAAVDTFIGANGEVTPMQTYYAALWNIRAQIDRVRDHLTTEGLINTTYLIFTADNGAGISDTAGQSANQAGRTRFYRGGKLQVLNGGVMPGIAIRGPGVPQGKLMTTAVVSHLDLAPSLCAMVGVTWTGDGHGEDRSEVFFGKDVQRQGPLFWLTTESNGSTVDMPNRGLPIRGFFPAAGPDAKEPVSIYQKIVDGAPVAEEGYDLLDLQEKDNLLNQEHARASRYGPERAATHAWFQSLGTVVVDNPDNWGEINPDLAAV